MVNYVQRHIESPLFKGVIVDAKAEISGECYEEYLLPRLVTLVESLKDRLRFAL